jgi:hypothetical protein
MIDGDTEMGRRTEREVTWRRNDADCRVSTAERDERQPLKIKKGDGG